jgi:hypothetical protein
LKCDKGRKLLHERASYHMSGPREGKLEGLPPETGAPSAGHESLASWLVGFTSVRFGDLRIGLLIPLFCVASMNRLLLSGRWLRFMAQKPSERDRAKFRERRDTPLEDRGLRLIDAIGLLVNL